MATDPIDKTYYCGFCGKSQHEVRKLIAGPAVFICDECVDLCVDIIGSGKVDGEAEYFSWFPLAEPHNQPETTPSDEHPWITKMRQKLRERGFEGDGLEAEMNRMLEQFAFLRKGISDGH